MAAPSLPERPVVAAEAPRVSELSVASDRCRSEATDPIFSRHCCRSSALSGLVGMIRSTNWPVDSDSEAAFRAKVAGSGTRPRRRRRTR